MSVFLCFFLQVLKGLFYIVSMKKEVVLFSGEDGVLLKEQITWKRTLTHVYV